MQRQLFKFIFLFSFSFLFLNSSIISQTTIYGKISDKETGEEVIGASIVLTKNGVFVTGAASDFDGNYSFPVDPGTYDMKVSYTGYPEKQINGIVAKAGQGTKVDVELESGVILNEVVVVDYKAPLIEQDNTSTGGTLTSQQIRSQGYAKINKRKFSKPQPYNRYNHSSDQHSNTEDYDAIHENRFVKVSKEPLSTFSIDVDAASYSNMRRFINNGQKPPIDAVRIEEMVNYFNYSYNDPTDKHPFEVYTEVADCPWNKDHRLFHIGLQGKKIETRNLPASNLVFLLDVSGSMYDQNKLPLLQKSLKLLVENLREEDRVAIVVYAGAAGTVLPSTSGANKQKIIEAIDKLKAGGSTAGAAGIKLAYQIAKENLVEDGNNRVILATDGDFNVGTSSDAELVRLIEDKRKTGVFLTVLGFGMGNYKDNKMQKLANKGNGNHAYIDNISEARKVLVNEFGGTLFTIAKDVKLQLEFNPAHVAGYRLIGYENRMLKNEDFNDDKKDAGELGAGHTVTAIYEIIPAGVESEYFSKVDKLKYQKTKTKSKASKSKELLTIKLRYKKPKGMKSLLIEKPVLDTNVELEASSDNFRWAAGVAEFGLLLRNSEFKHKANYDQAIKLAESAKGLDLNGYRAECIELMRKVRGMDSSEVGMK